MMDGDGFFRSRRVAIFGLGLMGGSLALALRGQVAGLSAVDPDPATRALALEKGIVDRISADPVEIVGQADVIILAAPVQAILEHLHELGGWVSAARPGSQPEGIIVIDLGSTKQAIVEAMQALPPGFDPLGGHPMCGKETSGLAHAEAGLFQGAPFAFTALERTGQPARNFAEKLAEAIGATPLWIDPATHDGWVAATSHLPYLLSCALAGATPAEAAPLVGPGFRSTSRLAASSLAVMLDILRTNRTQVLAALQRCQGQLAAIEKPLREGDFTTLAGLLAETAEHHQALIQNKNQDRKPG